MISAVGLVLSLANAYGSFYSPSSCLYSSLFIFITHFNLFFSRIKENFGNFKCPEEALVEDAKHYFTRDSPISVAKSLITSTPINNFDDESQEYMSPVVSEKSSYKTSVKNTFSHSNT